MQTKILWADDEIDLLKPHVLFLESKGYVVTTVNSGLDAIEKNSQEIFDVVFLDENMPGISGLDALTKIKEQRAEIPIVMITKSEEEFIMEEAIGSKIADYLIKPVNPNQILLSLKKIIDQSKLISQKTTSNYQQEFRQLGVSLSSKLSAVEWGELYKKMVYWEIELNETEDPSMREIINMQKKEANSLFSKFIERNYIDWLHQKNDPPQMIHTLWKNRISPIVEKEKTFVLVIDNLRYDQWKILQPSFMRYFSINADDIVYSILPSTTQYARNALFAGLMPSEIAKNFPNLWISEETEGGKNMHEAELLEANLKRLGKKYKWSYNKITNLQAGKKLLDNFNQLLDNQLNVIVYNFVDMLSHARTEMEVIKELADDEPAYRSLTLSWFEHSPLQTMVKKIAEQKAKLIITTDHGTVKVNNPIQVIGERSLNSNLRYKVGRNLSFAPKDVFCITNPKDAFIPTNSITSQFLFAREHDLFIYPNNHNKFLNLYANTFQHGGISLEELLIPFVELNAK